MKRNTYLIIASCLAVFLLPAAAAAQGAAQSISGLQPVLDRVYSEMLPLCSGMIGVGRGLAGFGALWYIASRVWRQLASAEGIDFYPLLRPFALGMAVMLFPAVLGMINGVLQPTVSATGAMVSGSNKTIERLLKMKEAAIKKSRYWQMYVGESGSGDSDKWYKYAYPDDPDRENERFLDRLGHGVEFNMAKASYNFRNSIKQWLSEVLEILYSAAALCINTVRTFFLIVLGILGPLVFGFAVFDGFQNTLTVWIARYVNIFLWLPICNIFSAIMGKVQENMLKLDLSQIEQQGDTFFSSLDTAYLIFLIIGIVGYFCVPNVANYVVHAGGGNTILQKVNAIVSSSTRTGLQAGKTGGGMVADALGDGYRNLKQSFSSGAQGDYFADNPHQQQRLEGK